MTQNPQAEALLAQLKPIVSPADVGLWPLAPGWWVLLALVLALCAAAIALTWRYWQAKAYRREALKLLASLPKEPDTNLAREVSALIKRVALTAYPNLRTQIAPLTGQAWVDFLRQTAPGCKLNETQNALQNAIYNPNTSLNVALVTSEIKQWIKTHKSARKLTLGVAHV